MGDGDAETINTVNSRKQKEKTLFIRLNDSENVNQIAAMLLQGLGD